MIPTAPVPFGGALICVKASWVQPAECGFDDLVGVYMSMGVTAPRCLSSDAHRKNRIQTPSGNVLSACADSERERMTNKYVSYR